MEKRSFLLQAFTITLFITLLSVRLQAQLDTTRPLTDVVTDSVKGQYKLLRGVTIEARKPRIEVSNNKLVMNVQNSALSQGKSALEILTQIPGVSLGQDDEILLRGSTGVNVMVDGKMTYLSGKQLSTYLQGLNAADIAKIELSTAPAAQYDAAGNAGIINIITRRNSKKAYAVELRSAVTKGSYWMVNENVTASLNTARLSLFGSLDFNTPHRVQKSSSGNRIREGNQDLDLHRSNVSTYKIKYYTYRAGIDWQLSPRQRLGAYYHGYFDDFTSTNRSNQLKYARENLHGISRSVNALAEPYHYDAINGSYAFDIDTNGKKFTVDFHYINYRNLSDGMLSGEQFDAFGTSTGVVSHLRSHQPGFVKIQSARADIVLPYKSFSVRAGIKYAVVSNDNNFRFDSLQGGNFVPAEGMSDHYRYSERISAAYLSFSKTIHKTTFDLGLRNEYTDANGYTVKRDLKNRWLYNRLFPTLAVEYALNKNNKLNVSASRRITRPVYTTLNPVRWYVDQYFYYAGNPELVPEMAWVFSSAYTLYNKYVFTGSYSYRTNYITRRLVPDETGAIKSQSANFHHMQRFDALLSVPFQATSYWDVQFTGGVNYTSYPINQTIGSMVAKKWAGSFQVQQQIKLPMKLHVELATYYYSPELFGVYVTDDRFYVDAGIKRTFLKGKLTALATFSDILRTNRYKGTSQTDLTDYQYYDRPDTHRFGLSVRYQIGGKLVNKRGTRIEEQDRL